MSAYVLIEATVRDEAARARYAPLAQPSAKEFGGEVLVTGPWHMLFGDPAFATGMLIRFPDKEAALAWYHSPGYQALLELRAAAFDCRFRLLG
jgi:uncharacterized protein (DUF1330 family)